MELECSATCKGMTNKEWNKSVEFIISRLQFGYVFKIHHYVRNGGLEQLECGNQHDGIELS